MHVDLKESAELGIGVQTAVTAAKKFHPGKRLFMVFSVSKMTYCRGLDKSQGYSAAFLILAKCTPKPEIP